MIIIQNPKKININQKIYDHFVDNLVLDDIHCPNCSQHSWSFHASYYRFIDFLGRRIKIRIKRIICNSCGKTHAILIESIIPFSCLNHDDIINILQSHYMDMTDSSHFYYLKNKFSSFSFYFYKKICNLCKRNTSLLFVFT